MKQIPRERKILSIAIWLHDYYEQFAKEVGWQTQKGTSVSFEDLPEKNVKTMLLLAEVVMNKMDYRCQSNDKEWRKKMREDLEYCYRYGDLNQETYRRFLKKYKLSNEYSEEK